jgi:hypothetical protein
MNTLIGHLRRLLFDFFFFCISGIFSLKIHSKSKQINCILEKYENLLSVKNISSLRCPPESSFLKKNERLKNAKFIFCEFQIEILQVEKKRNFEIRKN